jgi:hypothetical protein
MAIDTPTARSRRALIVGAAGGLVASITALAWPSRTRAGTDGDLVLETTNNDAGKARIYLNKVASTTASTPLAWFALG